MRTIHDVESTLILTPMILLLCSPGAHWSCVMYSYICPTVNPCAISLEESLDSRSRLPHRVRKLRHVRKLPIRLRTLFVPLDTHDRVLPIDPHRLDRQCPRSVYHMPSVRNALLIPHDGEERR